MPLHKKLSIKKIKGQFTTGKRDLFAVVIALRYLIGNEEFKQFKAKLKLLINKSLKEGYELRQKECWRKFGTENYDKLMLLKKQKEDLGCCQKEMTTSTIVLDLN